MLFKRFVRMASAFAFVAAFFVATNEVHGQQTGTLTGRITDSQTGAPIQGARVLVVGTNIAVSSNDEGRFTLRNLSLGQVTIRAIAIGYESAVGVVTVAAAGTPELTFEVSRAVVSLDEIVVTATGETRKREVANSVSTIDASRVTEEVMPTDIGSLIQGRATGVQILATSGTAGTAQQVRIRGSSSISLTNDPLLVVDGIRVENAESSVGFGTGGQSISRMNDFNPEDIESIEIVKGPSAAALYGTEAANGVIVITTKQGRAGAPRWNAWVERGISQEITAWPDNYLGLSAAGTACRLNDAGQGSCVQESIRTANPLGSSRTAPFKDGNRQQYGLNVQGGSQDVTYYIGGEWEVENGVYGLPGATVDSILTAGGVIPSYAEEPNRIERGNLRANLQARMGEKADVRVSTGFVSSDTWLPQNDNNSLGMLPSGLLGGTDSTAGGGWGFSAPEEVFFIEGKQGLERFTGSVTTTWRPTTWLQGNLTGGVDHTSIRDIQFQATGTGPSSGTRRQGNRTSDRTTILRYTMDAGLSAQFQLSNSVSSKTSVALQYFRRNLEQTETTGQILAPGSGSNKSASTQFIDEDFAESRTLGTFIEQQVGINDRFFLTGAIRADDNSAFGQDFSLVLYPKFGASLLLIDQGVGFLDNFKLRGAYGQSGQQPGSNDAVLFYNGTAVVDDAGEQVGVTIAGAGNVELKPERSTELEFGFDASMLGGRLGLEGTYYNRRTTDALINRNLPPSLGLTNTRIENIGETKNWGFEAILNASILESNALSWNMSLSGSTNDNEIVDLGCDQVDPNDASNCLKEVEPIIIGAQKHQKGYPLGAFFDEDFTYSDANGDGIIDLTELNYDLDGDGSTDSTVFLGYPIPRYEVSFFNSFELFNNRVRLSGLFDYRGGHKKYNLTEAFRCGFNICRGLNDPTASLEDQAQAQTRRSAVATNAGFLEPGWFIKLREVSLTFNAPASWARAVRTQNLRLIFTGRNLATITDYEGSDPEVQESVNNFGSRDFLTQPQVRYWTARLAFSF
jgi:TonB-linked SusC/RagA family outer membrane protein